MASRPGRPTSCSRFGTSWRLAGRRCCPASEQAKCLGLGADLRGVDERSAADCRFDSRGHSRDHRATHMEHLQSQLAAADLALPDDVLDRIDEIDPPGVTINPADNRWTQPALEAASRRR